MNSPYYQLYQVNIKLDFVRRYLQLVAFVEGGFKVPSPKVQKLDLACKDRQNTLDHSCRFIRFFEYKGVWKNFVKIMLQPGKLLLCDCRRIYIIYYSGG